MTSETSVDYRSILKREFVYRKRKNPSYSLRAFARDLEIPAPKLSQALRGIKGFSAKRAVHIALKLRLSEKEKEFFVALVEFEHSRSAAGKQEASRKIESFSSSIGFGELDLERFKIIADWYHFAILELTEIKDFESNPKWIAKRLGISVETARAGIERLLDFGLLTDENGPLKQTQADLATPSGIPSRELREHHSQILHKAEEALELVDIQERDFSAITLSISSEDLPEAKQMLKEFRRHFSNKLQARKEKDRVYCLGIQLFPVDKKTKRIEK